MNHETDENSVKENRATTMIALFSLDVNLKA